MAENLSNYKLSNGVMIPSLGFGTWQTPSGKVAIDSVKEALDAGYRHIDTAQMYENEESVGTGIKESNIARDEIFITSKLRNTTRGYEETIKAVSESLEKLQTNYADLFLIHWPNPISSRERWKEANAESWRAFEDLYKEGKLRSIGVSNFMPHHLDALAETAAITPMVNQIRLCPGDEPLETIQYCNDNHILLEAYSPLGTGRIFHIPELKELSTRYNKTIAQISLRWSLQKGYLPLPKSVTSNRIKENIEVYDFEISEKDMELLSGLESPFEKPVRPDETTW